jgi:Tol biopolymer transport system component
VPFDGSFSPDGRRFLLQTDMVSDDPIAGRRLAIIDVADGDPRPLATLPAESPAGLPWNPVWSPDGARIAALAMHGGVRQLATMSTTTGELRWLDLPGDVAPDAEMSIEAWSPDGTHVAVWAGGHLALVDATTGEWTATSLAGPLSPMSVAMAHDGRHLAMVSGPMLTSLDVTTGAVGRREVASAITAWSPDRTALAVLEATNASGSARVLAYDPWSDAPPSVVATIPGSQSRVDAVGSEAPCIQWLPEVPR